MNKLIIYTRFPSTVSALLKTHELVEGQPETDDLGLEVYYPDDAISQALAFWFAMAEGCGLISHYELMTHHVFMMEKARKEALQRIEKGKK